MSNQDNNNDKPKAEQDSTFPKPKTRYRSRSSSSSGERPEKSTFEARQPRFSHHRQAPTKSDPSDPKSENFSLSRTSPPKVLDAWTLECKMAEEEKEDKMTRVVRDRLVDSKVMELLEKVLDKLFEPAQEMIRQQVPARVQNPGFEQIAAQP